jgi:hypothetical protein
LFAGADYNPFAGDGSPKPTAALHGTFVCLDFLSRGGVLLTLSVVSGNNSSSPAIVVEGSSFGREWNLFVASILCVVPAILWDDVCAGDDYLHRQQVRGACVDPATAVPGPNQGALQFPRNLAAERSRPAATC